MTRPKTTTSDTLSIGTSSRVSVFWVTFRRSSVLRTMVSCCVTYSVDIASPFQPLSPLLPQQGRLARQTDVVDTTALTPWRVPYLRALACAEERAYGRDRLQRLGTQFWRQRHRFASPRAGIVDITLRDVHGGAARLAQRFFQTQGLGTQLQSIIGPVADTSLLILHRIDGAVAFLDQVSPTADAITFGVEIGATELKQLATRCLPLRMHARMSQGAFDGVLVVGVFVLNEHPVAAQRTVVVLVQGRDEGIVFIGLRYFGVGHAFPPLKPPG